MRTLFNILKDKNRSITSAEGLRLIEKKNQIYESVQYMKFGLACISDAARDFLRMSLEFYGI